LFWRCEGTTLSGTDDKSTGDTTAAATGGAVISAAAERIGTNGLLLAAAAATCDFRFDPIAIVVQTSEGAYGCWAYMAGNDIDANIIVYRDAGANDAIRLQIDVGNFVTFQYETGGALSEWIINWHALARDTWYFLIARWDVVGSRQRIEIYDTNGVLIALLQDTDALTACAISDSATGLRFGLSATITQTLHMDNVFYADDYEEPLQNNMFITSFTAYNGTPSQLPQLVVPMSQVMM
jgi:hypothetical protein